MVLLALGGPAPVPVCRLLRFELLSCCLAAMRPRDHILVPVEHAAPPRANVTHARTHDMQKFESAEERRNMTLQDDKSILY